MFFRIEDVEGFDPHIRAYDKNDFQSFCIDNSEIHKQIANMIRNEVNGAKSRIIHSYSKSLAVCLFKYNKFSDNELHIFFDDRIYVNKIFYTNEMGLFCHKDYSISESVAIIQAKEKDNLFNTSGYIILNGFVIDISNNDLLDVYLQHYSGAERKRVASPQKDCEVVVLNPANDQSIRNYIGAVYVIYALQKKYEFLLNKEVHDILVRSIMDLDDFRFYYGEQERYALVNVINYLAYNWSEEQSISQEVYNYLNQQYRLSACYDSICQYLGILENDFEESYDLIRYYQPDAVTTVALEVCACFLRKNSMNHS